MEDYIKDAVNASSDEILLEAYDKEWALTDLGKHEGFKEGFEKGIEQGISQGIEQGNYQKEIELTLNMLKENLDINLISKVTKLSIEEINSINKKYK